MSPKAIMLYSYHCLTHSSSEISERLSSAVYENYIEPHKLTMCREWDSLKNSVVNGMSLSNLSFRTQGRGRKRIVRPRKDGQY